MCVFRNSREKKAFCEAVQKEKEDIFCDVFWELSNRRQKTIIIRVFSRVRARRDSKNSVVVISKATEYYDI